MGGAVLPRGLLYGLLGRGFSPHGLSHRALRGHESQDGGSRSAYLRRKPEVLEANVGIGHMVIPIREIVVLVGLQVFGDLIGTLFKRRLINLTALT
jgi:hypothetical protein